MSCESKTVNDLCREALELRDKATQGEWNVTMADSIESWFKIWADYQREVCSGIMFSNPDGDFAKQEKVNFDFIAFAANNISAIAKRCLELEKELEVQLLVNQALSQNNMKLGEDNGKLREALKIGVDAVGKNRDESWSRWVAFVRIAKEALKGGG